MKTNKNTIEIDGIDKIILKALMKVKDPTEEGKNLITEIRTEVEKVVKPIIKKFPGAPPDIFM